MVEITSEEQNKGKIMKRIEDSLPAKTQYRRQWGKESDKHANFLKV